VKSERTDDYYEVSWVGKKWTCTCEDYKRANKKCKHIFAAIYYMVIREIVIGMREPEDEAKCPECGLNDQVIKRGFAYEKSGRVQRYYCKRCKRRFNYRSGLEGVRGEAMAIVLALDLFFRGLSLRQISQHLESVYGIQVSHTTIHGWIRRYVEIVNQFVEKIRVSTGVRWHCDETKVSVRGRHIILWSVLDSETKILIAQHISERRDAENARVVLEKALERAGSKPLEIITDGLQAYSDAIKEVLGDEVLHIQGPITGKLSNNVLERFYRTLKQRFKSIHNFGSLDGAETFAKGFEIFYNIVRQHQALGDKTPLESVGLKGAGCWLDLVRGAKSVKGYRLADSLDEAALRINS
ncbi:MAG: IS6 family transposase, partial [Candidatus Bathyarchaeia archaeon]